MEKISVIVPCYNEEAVINPFYEELIKNLNKIEGYEYEIVLIDDGSNDNTLNSMKKIKEKDEKVRIISFSRNFGKEAGIFAGLENCTGDMVVVMDGDLQHSPEKIIEMVHGIEERL